jgi:hypothetical protein
MGYLALPPIDEQLTEPVVLQGTYISQRYVEPVGDVYELYLMRRLGLLDEPNSDDEKENMEETEAVNKEKLNEKRKKANKDNIMQKLVFKNHYHALGLEHLQFDATIEDVRKAYKIKVLSHHPDKFEDGAYDEMAKQQWLSVYFSDCRFKMPMKHLLTLRKRRSTIRLWNSMTAFLSTRIMKLRNSSKNSELVLAGILCFQRKSQHQQWVT